MVTRTPWSMLDIPNAGALDKIGISDGAMPLWKGAAWPGSNIPGQVSSLSYSYTYGLGTMVAPQALKLTGGIAIANNNATVTSATNGADQLLAVVRDLRAATDVGTGGVNCGTLIHTVTKIGTQNVSEWNGLFILDQMSDGPGEHCAIYTQANKYGSSPTWGGCLQVVDYRDELENSVLMWGAEIDCAVSGYRPYGRGVTVVCQDAKEVTGRGASVDKRAGIAVAIEASGGSKWMTGINIVDFCDQGITINPGPLYTYTGLLAQSAMKVEGNFRGSLFNIKNTTAATGINLGENNTFTAAFAVNVGPTSGYAVGDLKVVGKRMPKWGYANSQNIADDLAGSNSFYRFAQNTDFRYLAETAVMGCTTVSELAFYVAIQMKAWGALITDLRAKQGHGLIGT